MFLQLVYRSFALLIYTQRCRSVQFAFKAVAPVQVSRIPCSLLYLTITCSHSLTPVCSTQDNEPYESHSDQSYTESGFCASLSAFIIILRSNLNNHLSELSFLYHQDYLTPDFSLVNFFCYIPTC